jgi:hypothetical protein
MSTPPIVPGMQVISLDSGNVGTVEKRWADNVRVKMGQYRFITVKVSEFWNKYRQTEEQP